MKVYTPYMDAVGIRKIIKYEFPFEKAFFARAMFFFQGGQFGSSSWYASVSKPYDASWVSCTPKIENKCEDGIAGVAKYRNTSI